MGNPERGFESLEKRSREQKEEERRVKEDLTPEEEKSFQETEEKLAAVTERIKKLRAFESDLLWEVKGFTYRGEKYIPPEIQHAIDKKKAELLEEFNQLADKFATIRDPKNKEKIDAVKEEIENI